MARTEKLPDAVLDTVASQIGSLYPSLTRDPNLLQQPAELAETFSIWLLRAEDVIKETTRISNLALNTGRWHSQVRIGGKALVAARSVPLGADPKDWQVKQIFEGEFAEGVDEAIKWIDEHVTDDPLVRVLEVPAFQITALWLVGDTEDHVVVARVPSGSTYLQRSKLYSSDEFLQALRKERLIVGIHP